MVRSLNLLYVETLRSQVSMWSLNSQILNRTLIPRLEESEEFKINIHFLSCLQVTEVILAPMFERSEESNVLLRLAE